MEIHLIAIGGSIMHNLALCLHRAGHKVTGSDDVIYDPAASRLKAEELLPKSFGWNPDHIHDGLDLIILGMHAKNDNPELLKAKAMGIPLLSFPEYIAKASQDKTRIVVAGSHGKTTTTSMIMHLFHQSNIPHDYMVGALLEGYNLMVQLTDAPYIILEGDEYLSSALDRRSKFLHYRPDICLLTGLDWDHVNVFPTYESYLETYRELLMGMESHQYIIYNQYDEEVTQFIQSLPLRAQILPYAYGEWNWQGESWSVKVEETNSQLDIPGAHNLINAMGALRAAHLALEKPYHELLGKMTSFSMPDKRLNLLLDTPTLMIFRDFAHAPSKVKATVQSMAPYLPQRRLLVVLEIHTYSSLSKSFLPQYRDTLQSAEQVWIFFNPKALEIKKMESLSEEDIKSGFNAPEAEIMTSPDDLKSSVREELKDGDLLLLMSSSNFGGIDWLDMQDSD